MTDIDSPTEDELRSLDRAERLIREGVRGDSGLIAAMILEAVYEARDDERSRSVGLEADNARLKAALQEVVDAHDIIEDEAVSAAMNDRTASTAPHVRFIRSIDDARRALKGKDEGGVMRDPAIVSVRSEIDDIRDCLAGSDVDALPTDYPTYQMARDRMDEMQRLRNELQRLRNALIKICDRAHKPQVGVISDSFNIAIDEAKTLLNETMNRPPYLHVGGQA